MVLVLRSKPDARSVIEPQSPAFWLFLGHLQTLPSPQTLDTLVVDLPSIIPQQRCDSPVTIPSVFAGQLDHLGHKSRLVIRDIRLTPLGRTRLTQYSTCPPLGDVQLLANFVHDLASAGRAQKFG
jgi:hypothetical protein